MFALQPELKVFTGSANRDLAERICKYIGVPLGQATISSFPDGETYVRIEENIRGHDVFIIQPTCPPTNQHLMELLIMVDAARRASADRITAVIPFFGYARQDRKDQPRVPITAKLVANLLYAAGVSRVLTMDLHAQQVQGFFDIPVDHLYSLPVLIKYLRQQLTGKTTVVSPAVLVDMAIPRLQKSKITELVTTNSTPIRPVDGFKITVLCVSELLGEGIKRIHNDESVSSLFNIENEKNGKTS